MSTTPRSPDPPKRLPGSRRPLQRTDEESQDSGMQARREYASNSPDASKLVDITARSSSMPRDSALLYRNHKPKSPESPHYLGLLKTLEGKVYWLGLWVRLVKGERALEVRLLPRKGLK